ncbi:MAG: insulinase family protein [Firmicutes bacterium]|nr:insulinase family protein [Bacillota bacterium]
MKNFKIIKEEWLEEYNSKAILFEHEKTKARVLKMENDDENKAFAIGFKTAQKDDTGVCHILEHSVLSGSRKYKTKEPFMDLIKNSLQTFVNAMTYDDKTMYPVSSRNEVDFHNLVDVYLDAVFFPDLHNNDLVFRQEGWHYELDNPEGELTINGIVYNEMKGAMSSDASQVEDKMIRRLYKNSSYCTNSGGDPTYIPTLTLDALREFHKKYYNPSNSYAYFWGNGDTEKELAHLDEYFSEFDYIEPTTLMDPIKDLTAPIVAEEEYCGKEESCKDFFVTSYICGNSLDLTEKLIHRIINSSMISEDGAHIKDRIISEGLASDVLDMYSVGDRLNFTVMAKDVDAKNKDKILAIIDEELDKLKTNGMDEKELASLIHQLKFSTKTFNDSPHKGILVYIRATESWIYGADPIEGLKYQAAIEKIEQHPELIKEYANKYFGKNRLELVVRPNEKLMAKREEELRDKLQAYKESLSKEEIDELINKTKELHDFQLREDTPEKKATIPVLDVKDLKRELSFPKLNIDGNLSHVDTFTGGIVDLCFRYFIEDMGDDKLKALRIVTRLLTMISTKKYDYKALNTEINLRAYDFDINIGTSAITDKDEGRLFVSGRLSFDELDAKEALDLYHEVLFNSDFSDLKKIRELLNTELTQKKYEAIQAGVGIALTSALKDISRLYAINELLSGASYIKYLEELLKLNDEELSKLLNEGYDSLLEILNEKAYIHATCDDDNYEKMKSLLKERNLLGEAPTKYAIDSTPKSGKKTAIIGLTDVNYCIDATSFSNNKGSYRVVSTALSNSYLHDNIRAKGGAYGDGISVTDTMIYMYSYRDPNLQKTFDVFDGSGRWLREVKLSKEEIDSLIIGSYSAFDPHLTPIMKSLTTFSMYLQDRTERDVNKALKEALSTTIEDFREFADRLDEAMKNKGRAVLTNEKGKSEVSGFDIVEL